MASIPRRILHIYSAPPGKPADVPLIGQAAIASSRLLNPDYEHVLFDAPAIERFLETEFPEHRETMRSFPLAIQRFDFFRYLAVYRLGGFYFDLDLFLARPLEPLLELGCVFPFEELSLSDYLRRDFGIDWEICNYGFGAAAGHPFLKAVIDNCVRGLKDPAWSDQVMRGIPRWHRAQFIAPYGTGPGLVTRTLAEERSLQASVAVLFPPDVCDQTYWRRFGEFGVHLMQGSWRGKNGYLRSRLGRIWENRRRRKLLEESRNLGPKRPGSWRCYPSVQ